MDSLLFSITMGIVLAVFYVAMAEEVADLFFSGKHVNAIYACAPAIIANAAAAIMVPYLHSREAFKESSLFRVAMDLIPYLGLVIGVIITENLIWGLVLYVLMLFAHVVWLLVRVWMKIGGPRFHISVLRRHMAFSWPLAINGITNVNMIALPRYVVPMILGPAALGVFNIMYTIALIVNGVSDPFLKYLNTRLPQLWDGGQTQRMQNIFEKSAKLYLVGAYFFMALMWAAFPPAVSLFLPGIHAEDLVNGGWTLGLLGLMAILLGLNGFGRVAARLEEKSFAVMIASILGLIVSGVLAYPATYMLGMTGMALAQVSGFLVIQAVLDRSVELYDGWTMIGIAIRVGILAVIAGIAGQIISMSGWTQLVMSPVIVGLTFIVSVVAFKLFSWKEVKDNLIRPPSESQRTTEGV